MNKKLLAEFRKELRSKKLTPLESLDLYIDWLENIVLSDRSDFDGANAQIIKKAFSLYGVAEIKGRLSEPKIIEMFRACGFGWQKDDSKLAWCSIFLMFICKELSIENTANAMARSWLKEGAAVEIDNLQFGDIVILWRIKPNSQFGHVGLFVKQDAHHIWLLGGNQGDKVQICRYEKKRFLGGRRL